MIRPRVRDIATALLLASTAGAVAESGFASSSARVIPALVREGPYGDPFATLPPLALAGRIVGEDWQLSAFGPESVVAPELRERREIVPGQKLPSGAAAAPPDPDRVDGIPARPGTFKPGPTVIPAPPTQSQKSRIVAPHTPDVEVQISKRASVGLFGEVGRVEVDRSGVLPSVKTHDVGAGLSLQYRFGQ